MTDLIQRLRSGTHNEEPVTVGGVEHDKRCLEAADEIERLQKVVERHESAWRIAWEIADAASRETRKTRNMKRLNFWSACHD